MNYLYTLIFHWTIYLVNLAAFAQGTVSTVACIVKDDNLFSEATEEDEFSLLLDRTIFYSEGGGQMADVGLIKSEVTVRSIANSETMTGLSSFSVFDNILILVHV